jgi:hypothetical protein
MKYVRLYDVFISGPIYIYFSLYIKNQLLKIFVFLTGFLTIIFNLHNFLFIDKGTLKKSIIPWTDPKEGKYQIHRIYNLFIMYPLLFYANYITKKPKWLTIILYLMIFIGFLFNLYWFIKISSHQSENENNNKKLI